jgi:hypothetical protein
MLTAVTTRSARISVTTHTPAVLWATRLPPRAVTMACATVSPRPRPWPASREVKKGSNARYSTCGAVPTPLSFTTTLTLPGPTPKRAPPWPEVAAAQGPAASSRAPVPRSNSNTCPSASPATRAVASGLSATLVTPAGRSSSS